ncbi:MAG: hypothetical protein E5Y88_29000 [Mesorhizobium sp.]|uniref:relaxase/mobilization nuclease domain-containing protein n=1 Tax=Mesorhizobium sp. TaxID=1871066 RepID=UPI0011FC9BE4|nr:relaxase/mobilization nuclease domain-containing protein [Mesorhizobium sp.]TIL22197.1 MAG: hypothetical protein E5Y88_29000 [Mesorhizobium sp.]
MPRSQAVIRIVPRGGARAARQIRDQLDYLSRKGAVDLQRSESHQGTLLPYHQLDDMARGWAEQTGNYQPGQPDAQSNQDLTTHIVVSFPRPTDGNGAHAAGRAWVKSMFGSGQNGSTFDYITAFHTDREHPHLHVVVNRRALESPWLKISRRHPHLNYNNMRAALVDAAYVSGIELDATSRADRGIMERLITYAEFRRRQRVGEAIAVHPQPEPDIPVTPRGTLEPPNFGEGRAGPGAEGAPGGPAREQGQNAGQGRQAEGAAGQQRRHHASGIIELRSQRAAREQQEAEGRARRKRRREPEPEDLDPNQPRRLRSGRECFRGQKPAR